MIDLDGLPDAALVKQGLADARDVRITPERALVYVAEPRFRSVGIVLPPRSDPRDAELELYGLLASVEPDRDAFEVYSAYLESLASFLDALDHRVRRARPRTE